MVPRRPAVGAPEREDGRVAARGADELHLSAADRQYLGGFRRIGGERAKLAIYEVSSSTFQRRSLGWFDRAVNQLQFSPAEATGSLRYTLLCKNLIHSFIRPNRSDRLIDQAIYKSAAR